MANIKRAECQVPLSQVKANNFRLLLTLDGERYKNQQEKEAFKH